MKTALVAGATGLIGRQLLQLLLTDSTYDKVKAITRRPLGFDHPKLENLVFNFGRLSEHKKKLQADDVFCCLGTTLRKAGSQEGFREIDYHYPLDLAKISKKQKASQFLLITALGADKTSRIFYNRVKGEIEEAIDAVGFHAYHIFRPAFLTGSRAEKRPTEEAALIFFKSFGWMLPRKYRAIDSKKVAIAMLHFARQNGSGKFIHESDELQNF